MNLFTLESGMQYDALLFLQGSKIMFGVFCHDTVPTTTKLASRGVYCSDSCVFCNTGFEDANHILFLSVKKDWSEEIINLS